jgi:hypothetical protein
MLGKFLPALIAIMPLNLMAQQTSQIAHGGSYVVLQDRERDSLVRVSADGHSMTAIASGAAGVGLAVDAAGNYVIAAKSRLLHVTPSGEVSVIAEAPANAEWIAVLVDADGSMVAADGKQPVLWRISANGKSITKAAVYDGLTYSAGREVTLTHEAAGDYWLLVVGVVDHTRGTEARFFHIMQVGAVAEISLKGERPRIPVAMVADGTGGFVFAVSQVSVQELTPALYRVTPDGSLTKLAGLGQGFEFVRGLARNPFSGDLIVAHHNLLSRVSAEGSSVTTLAKDGKLVMATAVIFEGATL